MEETTDFNTSDISWVELVDNKEEEKVKEEKTGKHYRTSLLIKDNNYGRCVGAGYLEYKHSDCLKSVTVSCKASSCGPNMLCPICMILNSANQRAKFSQLELHRVDDEVFCIKKRREKISSLYSAPEEFLKQFNENNFHIDIKIFKN